MIEWRDIGYVILKKSYKEYYNIIYVFTKEHGKVAGLIHKNCIISNFAYTDITYSSKYSDGLGFIKILKCKELWVHFLYDKTKIKMLDNICHALNLVLPMNADEHEIYNLTDFMYNELLHSNNILAIYQVFHAKLLEFLGYGNDTKKEQIVNQIDNIFSILPDVA